MATPQLLDVTLEKGVQLKTTRDVVFSSQMVSIGRSAYSAGPRIQVPTGSILTYTGQYYFGSDPGPGFPEFEIKTPTGETLKGHPCSQTLEWWSRIVSGWCIPLETESPLESPTNQPQPANP